MRFVILISSLLFLSCAQKAVVPATAPEPQTMDNYKGGQIEITLNVQFETGSSKIDQRFTKDLEKFGEFLVKYPTTYAEIEGHTDNVGNEKYNYRLSTGRANSVRKWILAHYKVEKKRLTSKGYGPSQPVGDNSTPEGRTKNRRVVAHVVTLAPTQ